MVHNFYAFIFIKIYRITTHTLILNLYFKYFHEVLMNFYIYNTFIT